MKLTRLKYFITVVDTGSLSAAAKQLNISQPTISVTIKELEEELGVTLFNRDRNRLVATDAGTFFYSRVITIFEKLENAVTGTRSLANHSNTVTIGIPPMIGTFFTPLMLSEFNRKMSSFDINIVEYDSDTLKNMLLNNLIDFAVLLNSFTDGVDYKDIFNEDYGLYVSPQNKLRGIDVVTFDDIKDEPFVVFDRILIKGSNGLAERFRKAGIRPVISVLTKQISTIKNYVKENVASTVLMEHCVKPEDGLVKVNLCDALQIHSTICLCWTKGKILNGNEKEVYSFISDISKKL